MHWIVSKAGLQLEFHFSQEEEVKGEPKLSRGSAGQHRLMAWPKNFSLFNVFSVCTQCSAWRMNVEWVHQVRKAHQVTLLTWRGAFGLFSWRLLFDLWVITHTSSSHQDSWKLVLMDTEFDIFLLLPVWGKHKILGVDVEELRRV